MEIGKRFGLSSPATVYKHLTHLQDKGLIRKQRNLSRAIKIAGKPEGALSGEFALLGHIAAGKPVEVLENREVVSITPDAADKDVFVLRVKGDSMIGDHIRDGDYLVVENREWAENGETVVALLDDEKAALKRFYREKGGVRLQQPATLEMEPIFVGEGDFKIQGVVIGVMRKFK